LTELPDDIGFLTKLQELNLCLNKLSTLPDTMEYLKELRDLNLRSNNFKQVIEKVKTLPYLTDVDLLAENKQLNNKLIEYVKNENIIDARQVIENGANVNYKQYNFDQTQFTTALFEAKSIAIIKLLLSCQADPFIERKIGVKETIKVWETKGDGENKYENFLTKKHPYQLAKFVKSLKIKSK
jgi:hypothetical protein